MTTHSAGDRVQYHGRDGVQAARVLKVHHDDQPPYYTVLLLSTGSERQTDSSKLVAEQVAVLYFDGASREGQAGCSAVIHQCAPDLTALQRELWRGHSFVGAVTSNE